MVIELTDTLLKYKEEQENLLLICITNLLISYYEGNHILMASPALCDTFMTKLTDERAKLALHYLSMHNHTDYDVLWKIKVVLSNADSTKYEMTYDSFQCTWSVQPTVFIGENLDDVRFYKYLTSKYHMDANLKCISALGGGDTTYDILSYFQSQNCFSLVIVDSDIRYPDCNLGRTAEKCKSKKKNNVRSVLKILPCHEAENLIPFSILKKISKKEGRDFLQRIYNKGMLKILKYYDVKKGIKKDDLQGSDKFKRYVEDIHNRIYARNRVKSFQYIWDTKDDKFQILPAINSHALEDFFSCKPQWWQDDEFECYRKEISDIVYTCLCARGDGPMY